MKSRKCIIGAVATTLLATAAMAATSSWSGSSKGPNVYAADSDNSSFFIAPSGTPTNSKITSISYSAVTYSNGSTSQTDSLCVSSTGSANSYTCYALTAKSGLITTGALIGQSAKQTFKITHQLHGGGTYPATTTASDTLKVNYSY